MKNKYVLEKEMQFHLQEFSLQDEMYKRVVPTGGGEGEPLGKQQAHSGQGKDQRGLAEWVVSLPKES